MARPNMTAVFVFVLLSLLSSQTAVRGQTEGLTTLPPMFAPEYTGCRDVQNRFQSMEDSCTEKSQQFARFQEDTYRVDVPASFSFDSPDVQATSVVVDRNQFAFLQELESSTLEARVTYKGEGRPSTLSAIGQVSRVSSSVKILFPRPLPVLEGQILNVTLWLQGQPLANPTCSGCVGVNFTAYRTGCNFAEFSPFSNGRCLRVFSAWRTKLVENGGAGACQDAQLDRQFLERHRDCFVRPSIQYITSRVEGALGEPARLACVPDGNPVPSVRWRRKGKNLAGSTIVVESVTSNDTGIYMCVAEEREFFNQSVRANATLELQVPACAGYQKTDGRLLRECSGVNPVVRSGGGCGQFTVRQQNATVTIDQIQLTLLAEGELPWVRPGAQIGVVNLNVSILLLENGLPDDSPLRRRRGVESENRDNRAFLKRFKRQNPPLQEKAILHQQVYHDLLAIADYYELSVNITIEPVDVSPGSMLLIKVAEDRPNSPSACGLYSEGVYPSFQLRAYSFQPCELQNSSCRQRYSEWIAARKAVPDDYHECVGADFVTAHYSRCFVPPEVSLGPSESLEVFVGETATITCNTTGFPRDLSYQWTVDGTVVPNQRNPVFRFDAVSGVHKVKCKVTGEAGEAESAAVTVTVLPVGSVTCGEVQSLFASMRGLCVTEDRATVGSPSQDGTFPVFLRDQGDPALIELQATSVTVDWKQFSKYHGDQRARTLTAQVTYAMDGRSFRATAVGQVSSDSETGSPVDLGFPEPLVVQQAQNMNITLRLQPDNRPVVNLNCTSCVALNVWVYNVGCGFTKYSRDFNGPCLRSFWTWRTKLVEKGGAGVCQDPQLDQQFLQPYQNCLVSPSVRYITSQVKAFFKQPAMLACIAAGNPLPSVRWLQNGKPANMSARNTILFDSVTPADTGTYTCVAEEREFFNQTVTATATLELQGLGCTRFEQAESQLLGRCAREAQFYPLDSCRQFTAQQNTSIHQLRLTSGEVPFPWIPPGEAAGVVNLNVTIQRLVLQPRRRRASVLSNQPPGEPAPVILHQHVYQNVLVLKDDFERPHLNLNVEPVDVTVNDVIQVDIAEEGPNNPPLCESGLYPELVLRGYSLAPCDEGGRGSVIPTDFIPPRETSELESKLFEQIPPGLQSQDENMATCQQRYSDWLVARKAVSDVDGCAGADVVTSQYHTCFVPPKVNISPSEIQDLVVGETVTITCNTTGFPSDYSYQWTVDGTVVSNQRGPVFSYNAVSDVHKVRCKVTSSGGETESEESTVTVLPEGTMTFVSSIRITGRSFTPEMADPGSAAFQNISTEIKDWYLTATDSVPGKISIRVKDTKPGSVIASQNVNVQDSALQDQALFNSISGALRAAAQSPSSLGIDPASLTLLSATTCYSETVTVRSSSGLVTVTFPNTAGDTHVYSTQRCASNTESADIPLAVRRCMGSFQTGVSWASPELLDCGLDLSKLAQMPVTPDNVAEVAAELQILTSIGSSLMVENITDSATVLDNLVNTTGDENVGYSVVVSVDQIMNSAEDVLYQSQVRTQAPSRIVQALEGFSDRVNLTTNRFRRIERNIGVETYQVRAAELINSVGFASLEGGADLENGLVQSYSDASLIPIEQVDASIVLPEELGAIAAFLQQNIPDPTDVEVRLSFVIYQTSGLFPSNQTAPSSGTKTRVNSRVISSRVTGLELNNLPRPVVTRYLPVVQNSTNNITVNNSRCVFWDFSAGGGAGAWSTEGCDFVGIDNDRVVCECSHLTNFAVLMDIYGGLHSFALDLISKIGIALSITGLTLTLITYLVFKQLRQTRPQHILINLCIALLATLIIFLAGINATSSPVGCTVVAFFLHYFLLAVFMWMAIEAFNMYLAFVKVLGAHVSKFLLKAAIFAWGVPFIIAIITLVVDVPSTYPAGKETYRSTSFCWLQGQQLYFGFLLPAGLVLLFNTVVYAMVINKLACRGRTKGKVADPRNSVTKQQLRIAIAVMVLVGLTWIFGFFMISDGRIVFSYLFCIFNSLQGFLIFIFQCLRQKEVQNLWFKVLLTFRCCGCPVDEYRATKSTTGKSSNQTESTAESDSRGHRKSSAAETLPINIPMNKV